MFADLVEAVRGPWWYPYLFLVSALDVVFPVVPSEASVIAAGVLAGRGDLLLPLLIACAAAGAILGDNLSYGIGRFAGPWVERRFFAADRRKRLEWAQRSLEERGGYLIVVARFIPGGRTAVTLSAGILRMSWRRFIVFDVAAGLIWANYAALLGFFGGRTFEEEPWKGLLLAFAIAFGLAAAVETYRWLRRRRLARG